MSDFLAFQTVKQLKQVVFLLFFVNAGISHTVILKSKWILINIFDGLIQIRAVFKFAVYVQWLGMSKFKFYFFEFVHLPFIVFLVSFTFVIQKFIKLR